MAKSVACISLHGMGKTEEGYADKLFDGVRARLGADTERVCFHELLYQEILQINQQRLWDQLSAEQRLDWKWARRFLLFNLSDAVGLEAGKDNQDSSYLRTQVKIADALLHAKAKTEEGPVVVIAQSLGGQVFSSYLYDSQRWRRFEKGENRKPPTAGIWTDGKRSIEQALGHAVSDDDIAFLRGATVRALITTGCNIPVFVAAHKQMLVRAIEPPRTGFEWHNYFDRDDVLGWPLQPLEGGYRELVRDHSINAGGLFESWNWRSHLRYWEDGAVLDEATRQLRGAFAHRGTTPPTVPLGALATAGDL